MSLDEILNSIEAYFASKSVDLLSIYPAQFQRYFKKIMTHLDQIVSMMALTDHRGLAIWTRLEAIAVVRCRLNAGQTTASTAPNFTRLGSRP